jgi:transcription antitermination factor NusG
MSKKNAKNVQKTPTVRKAKPAPKAEAPAEVTVTVVPPGPEPKAKKTPEEKEAERLGREAARQAKVQERLDRKQDREALKATRDLERAAEKLAKATVRATKKAEREAAKANKVPAHLAKVQKAAEKLPALSVDALTAYETLVGALATNELSALVAHLALKVRIEQTKAATNTKLSIGDRVRVTAGDPKFVGLEGTVTEARRIRCFVELPGRKAPVYLFTSDVEKLESDVATGTEG